MIMAILPLVESVAMLIGMFAISYRLDPELALLSLVVVPFIYLLRRLLQPQDRPRASGGQDASSGAPRPSSLNRCR